jgi:hypothetical protein
MSSTSGLPTVFASVELGDDQVLVVARIADDGGVLAIPR